MEVILVKYGLYEKVLDRKLIEVGDDKKYIKILFNYSIIIIKMV